MLNNVAWLWLWQLDHQAAILDSAALQAVVALWTARERVRVDLGGCLTAAPMVVVRRAFLAWALGLISSRGAIGFDEGRQALSCCSSSAIRCCAAASCSTAWTSCACAWASSVRNAWFSARSRARSWSRSMPT
jgi:hypothetical protein